MNALLNVIGSNVLAEAPTLSDITGAGTSVLTWMTTSVTSIMQTALSSPVVLVFIGCALVGTGVGFAKKLMHI